MKWIFFVRKAQKHGSRQAGRQKKNEQRTAEGRCERAAPSQDHPPTNTKRRNKENRARRVEICVLSFIFLLLLCSCFSCPPTSHFVTLLLNSQSSNLSDEEPTVFGVQDQPAPVMPCVRAWSEQDEKRMRTHEEIFTRSFDPPPTILSSQQKGPQYYTPPLSNQHTSQHTHNAPPSPVEQVQPHDHRRALQQPQAR